MITWAERNDGYMFLALTLIVLACHGLGWAPGQVASLVTLAAGVTVLGLPHGSLDLLVAQRLMRTKTFPATLLFASIYLAIAVAYGLVWWWSASFGLVTFLLISALHFGSDWQGRAPWITRLAYGLSVVTLPAVRHGAEVTRIYGSLGVAPTLADQLVSVSRIAAIATLVIALSGAAFSPRRRDLAEFAGIIIGALLLPPLIYFGLYSAGCTARVICSTPPANSIYERWLVSSAMWLRGRLYPWRSPSCFLNTGNPFQSPTRLRE